MPLLSKKVYRCAFPIAPLMKSHNHCTSDFTDILQYWRNDGYKSANRWSPQAVNSWYQQNEVCWVERSSEACNILVTRIWRDQYSTWQRRDADASQNCITGMLHLILDELKKLRSDRHELKCLRKDMDSLQVTVVQQQFLERIDSREREKNIVITGIPEDDTLNGAQSDKEKCDEVFKVIKGFLTPQCSQTYL